MKKLLLAVALLVISFAGVSYADIFSPIGESPKQPVKLTLTPVTLTPTQEATLLTDVADVVDYLGVREGEAYNISQHRFVTTTGATVITYAPWNLGLGITMLNDDGVTADLDWNIGAYVPASSPINSLTKYLYVMAGVGGEENIGGTAFKLATTTGAEFKFNF